MLFSSFEFFLFLAIVLSGYYALGRASRLYAVSFLVCASLFFYGWWKLEYLFILLSSILFNFYFVKLLKKKPTKAVLTLGVLVNLGLLAYYKYAGFLVINLNAAFELSYTVPSILLPLAISFFTFQQIAFLVDSYKNPAIEYDFLNYTLFVTFFPQLIAGPIVHHSEMMPQFKKQVEIQANRENIVKGLSFFALGLFKKIVIADTLAMTANPVFDAADSGQIVSVYESWLGALAYSFQLYFDFSGYADMAIGIALMFNINLPTNFNSPYKARNIVEFWRRWHMTLSRFLRDYLYIALGGNRKGQFNRYRNLFLTMLLGGLWHGAGWNFVIWGALHGSYLCINHLWGYLCQRFGNLDQLYPPIAAYTLTFLSVVVAWVFFRAVSFDGALGIIKSMGNMQSSSAYIFTASEQLMSATWILLAAGLAFKAPNTAEFISLNNIRVHSIAKLAGLISIGMMWVLLINQQTQEFIYFNF